MEPGAHLHGVPRIHIRALPKTLTHTLSHNVGNSRMLICGLARPTPARERKLGADQDRRTCAPSPQTLDNNNIAPLRKDTTRCLRIVWRHAPNTP